MRKSVPPDERWQILCAEYAGAAAEAAAIVSEAISADVHYVVTLVRELPKEPCNLVLIGTRGDEELTSALGEEPQEKGYIVKVCDSPYFPGKKAAFLVGDSPVETLYAAVEFADDYKAAAVRGSRTPQLGVFDRDEFSDYYVNTVPFLKRRGIWTWGHCIYDYRRFFKNMARLKLNRITIWNDYVPVNMQRVIEYAHSLGIAVVLGFSWGWDTDVTKTNPDDLEYWKKKILEDYRRDYALLNHDGIYFQTFTETTGKTLRGHDIAREAVRWANEIGGALLEAYPELEIQFGLHATSVNDHLDTIAMVDRRIHIIWEDCGDFPWDYRACEDQHQRETEEFTEKIAALRDGTAVGGVLKGHVCLDWSDFEHQTAPFILGENPLGMKKHREYSLSVLRKNQSWWLKNAGRVQSILKLMGPQADISALVEDGFLEEHIWFTAAVYAQLVWEVEGDAAEIMSRTAERENVIFA